MLLKRLALTNIRSYNDGEEMNLELPEGVVLFEGDTGSGKSTLLYALEFALFGFSDMKGAHLLSEGRKEGEVSVTFEAGDAEYTIDRRLKVRGDDVIQSECYITTGHERTRLSPSDLKERVVSILGFNEPTHPRAESLVYRYAVFTPQEQMKDILVQNAEERLHVIRRVLGAQSYQVAAENSEIVERRIKEISFGLKKASEDLEERRNELQEKARSAARLELEIPRLREKEVAASRLVISLEAEWKEALGHRESLAKAEARIPLLKQETADLKAKLADEEDTLKGLEGQLAAELNPRIKSFEAREKPMKSRDLERELDGKKEKLIRLKDSKQTLQTDVEKSRDLIAKGVCPLCGQRISGELPARAQHEELELNRLEGEIREAAASVTSLEDRLESARTYEEDEREYARALKERVKVEADMGVLRKTLQHTNARLSTRVSELTEASAQLKALQELSDKIDALEYRVGQARQEDKRASVELNEAKTELAEAVRAVERLTADVKKKQGLLDETTRLATYQGWLSTFFRPAVGLIEKQTLSHAAARFNEHFQRFFNSLVDDPDMLVRVKEDFSPMFEREGFEQDFEALSGGERTSMALAYRFALNAVVKESIQTKPELVILDEPTDGFSREQVYKMRGLLEELGSRQVILVSHERELESMADHIFRVEKRNGSSVITDVHA